MIQMYDLIEYSKNYAETSGSLWQYSKEDPNDNIIDSESFKLKSKLTGKILVNWNTKDVGISAPIKYLSNFWRSLEMPLTDCKINRKLSCPANCVVTN